MPEPMSPEGPRQPITPALPEQPVSTHEIKQFPIKVDGKETHYPENYPFSFIADGPIAEVRRVTAFGGERTGLTQAIEAYLKPSQEIFGEKPPEWYIQTLAPLLEKSHLSLRNLKPENLAILGDNFRGALEQIWDFDIPEQLRTQAARSMGQTEGTIPTLSALIRELMKSDSIRFEQLMTKILEKGPDGLVLAAYLAAPKSEIDLQQSEINFDKVFSVGEDGRIQINPDPKVLEALRNVSFDTIKQAFEKGRGNISYDAWQKAINSAGYQTSEDAAKNQNFSPKSFTSYGPNGEPYRMIGNPPPPEREPIGFDAWKKIRNTTAYKSQEPVTPDEEK